MDGSNLSLMLYYRTIPKARRRWPNLWWLCLWGWSHWIRHPQRLAPWRGWRLVLEITKLQDLFPCRGFYWVQKFDFQRATIDAIAWDELPPSTIAAWEIYFNSLAPTLFFFPSSLSIISLPRFSTSSFVTIIYLW